MPTFFLSGPASATSPRVTTRAARGKGCSYSGRLQKKKKRGGLEPCRIQTKVAGLKIKVELCEAMTAGLELCEAMTAGQLVLDSGDSGDSRDTPETPSPHSCDPGLSAASRSLSST